MDLSPGLRWAADFDTSKPFPPNARGLRFKVAKPRLPWTYGPRRVSEQVGINCGSKTIRWKKDPGAQVRAEWIAKNCGARKTARQFDAGGPEAGTLVGARRAAGLFDEGWGQEFPLTRKEREAIASGKQVLDPFFAPPTTPHPSNWIEDKLQRLRGTFGATTFTAPASLSRFCPQGGSGITCAGPNAEVIWTVEGRDLTAAEKARFTDAYCKPGVCVTGSAGVAPEGVTERIIAVRPRNPAVAVKASCQPIAQPGPVVQDVATAPLGPPPVPVTDWSCTGAEQSCVGANCNVRGQERTMRWKTGVPMEIVYGWIAANCGPGA